MAANHRKDGEVVAFSEINAFHCVSVSPELARPAAMAFPGDVQGTKDERTAVVRQNSGRPQNQQLTAVLRSTI